MSIHFNKMQGAGNSYIYISSTSQYMDANVISSICHQHYGIGADGVVLLLPTSYADVQMIMYNKDGSRGAICGNALRCIAKLLYMAHHRDNYSVLCDCGIVNVGAIDNDHYSVQMPAVTIGETLTISSPCAINCITLANCGNNHAVAMSNITESQLLACMPTLNNQLLGNYNVEVAHIIDRQNVNVLVYERGSGLTLSCGSGAVAVMAVLHAQQLVDNTCNIHMSGGTLTVSHANNIYTLCGDAHIVCIGDIL